MMAMELPPSVLRAWETFYPNYTGDEFKDIVASHLKPAHHILEIGAGSGLGDQYNFGFKGKVKKYAGVDLDPRVIDNPGLDEAYIVDGGKLPFPDNTFDVVFHTMVAEHVENPDLFTSECARVLKPGGTYLFQTPSRFFYPMIVASITPHAFHEFYIKNFASGRESEDVFPTVYKLNTKKAITKVSTKHHLDVNVQFLSAPPPRISEVQHRSVLIRHPI